MPSPTLAPPLAAPLADAMARRRSVAPQFLDGPAPDADELRTLLTLASRVPDHGKLAPWRFLVLEGDARHRAGEALARIARADDPSLDGDRLAAERGRLARAPLVVGVVSRAGPHVKIPEWEQVLSAGAVCMNLLHAAHALGFAAAWLTEWMTYDRRALDALGLAPSERLAGLIHVGRPAATPADRPRPDLADLVARPFA